MPHIASRLLIVFTALLLIGGCASLKKDYDETADWSAQKIFEEGKKELANKKYDKAIEYFELLESRYPYGPYATQAQLETAYAYYKYEEPESAIAAADRFIRLHPTHPNVDYAWYLKGLVNFADKAGVFDFLSGQGDLSDRDPKAAKEAFDAFTELVERFPDSKYAPDARQRLAYLLNALARHDIQVGKFYLDRGAWVAAVNRAKYVIERYPDTPAVEDALGIMAQAYVHMNMPDLAAAAPRVLKLKYPPSTYRKKLQKLANK